MDRDKREERKQLALDALVKGEAEFSADPGEEAVRKAYERGETDEFIKPTLVGKEARIRAGDSAIFFNFRPDRARQLTEALGDDVKLTTLTQYQEHWSYPVAFPPARPDVTLASTLADRGIVQLHVAETEKYAHVTYVKKPEMSAAAAADAFVERWREGDFGFGIINFANADMVGHTGVIEAAVKGIETVDECLARRPHAGGRRQPQHRPLDEPGSADRDRGRR